MPRTAKMVIANEPVVYHIMSRKALDRFPVWFKNSSDPKKLIIHHEFIKIQEKYHLDHEFHSVKV